MGSDIEKTRRPWREVWATWREALLLAASLLVSLAVGGVTGWGSWGHIVHIGKSVGEPAAAYLPVAIDGMMLNGTVTIAIDRFRGRVARPWAVVSLWLGSAFTLGFNVASAWERGFAGMLIAVMYAIALLCTVEATFRPSHVLISEALARKEARRAEKLAARATRTGSVPAPAPVNVPPAAQPATEPTPVPAPATTGKPDKRRGPRPPAARKRVRGGTGHPGSGVDRRTEERAVLALTADPATDAVVDAEIVPDKLTDHDTVVS